MKKYKNNRKCWNVLLAIIIQEKERSVWMLSVLCGQPVTMTK